MEIIRIENIEQLNNFKNTLENWRVNSPDEPLPEDEYELVIKNIMGADDEGEPLVHLDLGGDLKDVFESIFIYNSYINIECSCPVEVFGGSHGSISGSRILVTRDNAKIDFDGTHVTAKDSSRVEFEISTRFQRVERRAYASSDACLKVHGDVNVMGYNNAHIIADSVKKVQLSDSASIRAYGETKAILNDYSKGDFFDNSHATLHDSSLARIFDSASFESESDTELRIVNYERSETPQAIIMDKNIS